MLKKLFVYWNSDGAVNLMRLIYKSIIGIFYKKSVTILLHKRQTDSLVDYKNRKYNCCIKHFCSEKDLEEIDFPRLLLTPYKKWFSQGSIVFVFFHKNTPIAYTWSHYNKYTVRKTCIIYLSECQSWIGPTFVLKKYRGKGINKNQIIEQINNHDNVYINEYLTSVNINNKASLYSFYKLGFEEFGRLKSLRVFGFKIKNRFFPLKNCHINIVI